MPTQTFYRNFRIKFQVSAFMSAFKWKHKILKYRLDDTEALNLKSAYAHVAVTILG